ncbi:hypothetical protein BGZ83_002049 [Gryganskiella cystojenkinii]|nr:hypothetical protein BGZ83_002049 [Gryganskiella cystojenkinii]
MENQEVVKLDQLQETLDIQPMEEVVPTSVESSIPTPIPTEENSPTAPVEEEESSVTSVSTPSKAEDQSEESTEAKSSTNEQERASSHTPRPAAPAAPAPQLKRRPRRTGQPLHLLLQDCSKQHIYGSLSKKTAEDIKAVISDKKALAAELRTFSNDFVLTSARDRVIGEVDEEGKELLKDVDPERDVIKQRFEDESSVFKAYDEAIHDIRVDLYLDSIKPRAQDAAATEAEDNTEATNTNTELNAVLQVWETIYKRVDTEPRRAGRATQGPYPPRTGRPAGLPGRPHPYAPPRASSAGVDVPPPRDHRDYRGYERGPYRDDYYGRDYYDRRDPRDLRGPPGPMSGRPDPRDVRDMRDPRDYRERGPPPPPAALNGRYDDRRRDPARASVLSAHPSLPPKPAYSASSSSAAVPQHGAHQPPNPAAAYAQHYTGQQTQTEMQAAHAAYGAYGYPVAGQADYSNYAAYGAYAQDPAAAAAAAAAYYGGAASGGWDMSGATTAAATSSVAHQVSAGLQLQPFSSGQAGRHRAVPLPTDFMAGPSEAPRLSMPEPHEVLGTIRGVIIRDAQGNIGLSQYHFTQAS